MNFISTAITMSIVVSILLLFRQFILSRYSAKVMCILWLVIAIRMLIPLQIQFPISYSLGEIPLNQEVTKLPRDYEPVVDTEYTQYTGPGSIYYNENKLSFTFTLEDLLKTIYLLGGCIVTLSTLYSYYRLKRVLLRHRVLAKKIDGIDIYVCEHLLEPISFGVFNPAVYLPTEQDLSNDLILSHEIHHCKNKDGLAQLMMVLVKVIYWFNPLVYLMEMFWVRDREIFCDEVVVNELSDKNEYMNTLLDAAEKMISKRNQFSNGLLDGKNGLKERFVHLTSKTVKKTGNLTAVVLAAGIILSSFVVGYSEQTLYDIGIEKVMRDEATVETHGMYDVTLPESKGISTSHMGFGTVLYLMDADRHYFVDNSQLYNRFETKEEYEAEFNRLDETLRSYAKEIMSLIASMEKHPIDTDEYNANLDSLYYDVVILGDYTISYTFRSNGTLAVTTQDISTDRTFDEYSVVETYKVNQDSVKQLCELMLDIEFWYYSEDGPWWINDSSWWESHGQHLQRARQESE